MEEGMIQARAMATRTACEPVWMVAAFVLVPFLSQSRLDWSAVPPRASARHLEALTRGETRVLDYLPTNLSSREIADDLYLSVNTVRTHQRHLYQKLGARTRTQAVQQARVLGLLTSSAGAIRKPTIR